MVQFDGSKNNTSEYKPLSIELSTIYVADSTPFSYSIILPVRCDDIVLIVRVYAKFSINAIIML